MAHGKNRADWDHTSYISALLLNINRDPKKQRAVQPHELNPYARARAAKQKPDFYITPGQLAQKIVGGGREESGERRQE